MAALNVKVCTDRMKLLVASFKASFLFPGLTLSLRLQLSHIASWLTLASFATAQSLGSTEFLRGQPQCAAILVRNACVQSIAQSALFICQVFVLVPIGSILDLCMFTVWVCSWVCSLWGVQDNRDTQYDNADALVFLKSKDSEEIYAKSTSIQVCLSGGLVLPSRKGGGAPYTDAPNGSLFLCANKPNGGSLLPPAASIEHVAVCVPSLRCIRILLICLHVVVGAADAAAAAGILCTIQQWLFQYELPETIIAITASEIFIVASGKKIDFLKGLEQVCAPSAGHIPVCCVVNSSVP